jgi:hypothetical protein
VIIKSKGTTERQLRKIECRNIDERVKRREEKVLECGKRMYKMLSSKYFLHFCKKK